MRHEKKKKKMNFEHFFGGEKGGGVSPSVVEKIVASRQIRREVVVQFGAPLCVLEGPLVLLLRLSGPLKLETSRRCRRRRPLGCRRRWLLLAIDRCAFGTESLKVTPVTC